MKSSLLSVTLGLLLLSQQGHCRLNGVVPSEEFRRLQSLEMYQRATPPPSRESPIIPPPTQAATTEEPTSIPTTPTPTRAPTDPPTDTPTFAPTDAPTTSAPTNVPTSAPTISTSAPTVSTSAPTVSTSAPTVSTSAPTLSTSAPTDSPTTEAPQQQRTVEPTNPPAPAAETNAPTDAPAATVIVEAEPTEPNTVASGPVVGESIYTDGIDYEKSLGEVYVEFSFFCPVKAHTQINFMNTKKGACESVDSYVCDAMDPIKEQGPQYCAVRDDTLLQDYYFLNLQPQGQATEDKVGLTTQNKTSTIMALSNTSIKELHGIVHGQTGFDWTRWRMTWDVLQLGTTLRQQIVATYGQDGPLTEEDFVEKGIIMLQQMMSVKIERIIREGIFQRDIQAYLNNTMQVSVVGEEEETFADNIDPLVGPPPLGKPIIIPEATQGEVNDDESGSLKVVFFFAGLGVVCLAILALLFFSCRERMQSAQKSVPPVYEETASSKETADSPRSRHSEEKVVIVDAEDPPRGGRETHHAHWEEPDNVSEYEENTPHAHWEEPDNVSEYEENTASEYEEPTQVSAPSGNRSGGRGNGSSSSKDLESHFNSQQSMAQSSVYTGSAISAITGVSGMSGAGSDTWSVGSMSIDLAEWGDGDK